MGAAFRSTTGVHPVRIYYEDTDLSGAVYHANYLKYFERGREHLLGPDELVRLLDEQGVGFVVYKCELTFKEPARLGDVLEIRTSVSPASDYRLSFDQAVWRPEAAHPMVFGTVELVCVDAAGKLVRVPDVVTQRLAAAGGSAQ
jgi:acyl-CoA thioester hydrolase